MKPASQIVWIVAMMALAAAIYYCAITLTTHSQQLDCLTKVINQALGEAFRHDHIKPPPSCN